MYLLALTLQVWLVRTVWIAGVAWYRSGRYQHYYSVIKQSCTDLCCYPGTVPDFLLNLRNRTRNSNQPICEDVLGPDPQNNEEENEEFYDTIDNIETVVNNDTNDGSQIRNRGQGVSPIYVGEDESQNHEYEDPTEPDSTEENGEGPAEPGSTEDNRDDTREVGTVGMTNYSDDNNAQHNSSNNEAKANDRDSWNEEAGDGQVDKKIYDSDTSNISSRNNSNSEILSEGAHREMSDDESCEGRVEMKDYT